MDTMAEQLGWIWPLIINAGKALLVLIGGWVAAGMIARVVRNRVMAQPQIDDTVGIFMANLIRYAILLMVLIAVLNIFGVEATSLVAVLGAASLAIGLALQGTLSHVAAGFMLVIFRPYKLGHFVDIGGSSGTVKAINLFFTELATPQNEQVIVPNGQAWGSVIVNFSYHPTRRADLVFGIDYADDIDKAMEIILRLARADGRVLDNPEPWVRVTNLGTSSVDLTARLWAKSDDFWEMQFDVTKAVKEAFDAEGVSIPYPHTVEIQKEVQA
ncbi:mechanosensitive ion channel [Abyssibius alkaniclasticus]|uniref:mechanosensitive ion channel family protein n=1 Tax=Abyssibius alkaniclasticus TaxID=2881234 RepID=UPI0023640D4A|nr:mechanosensitive ion channel domain-containing protein [Abyssibius alkaniclasticus]UPH71390.1 mechanosensitive ion channel [Abyssibius alkaniclasticus]